LSHTSILYNFSPFERSFVCAFDLISWERYYYTTVNPFCQHLFPLFLKVFSLFFYRLIEISSKAFLYTKNS